MLPGFRFLFAAVVLSMSILVFGFGAAALLRTAHEEFANTPSWQPAPETRFAQSAPALQPAPQPVLAMLRVDDPPKDAPKQAANAGQPASNDTLTNGTADQSIALVQSTASVQPDKISAVQPADSPPPETAKLVAPVSEAPATDSAARAEAAPAAADATRLAATEPAPPPASEAAPAAPAEAVAAAVEQPDPANAATTDAISTRIATLGGPPATIASPVTKAAGAKADGAKSDTNAVKNRQHARRERRRRSAARARLVKQTQTLDPFGQPTTTAGATR
jgi:hypothetical protein